MQIMFNKLCSSGARQFRIGKPVHRLLSIGVWMLSLTFNTVFGQAIYKEDGLIKTTPYSYPGTNATLKATLQAIKNQNTTAAQELGYWQRAQPTIDFYRPQGGGQFFENEKALYPHKMFKLLWGVANQNSGDITEAKNNLQADDIYSWAAHTDYVDLFANFTLNGQLPKYFFFGKHAGVLDPAYVTRMYNAANLWSSIDPNGRPHPNFIAAQGGCYTPECVNSWVDTRNTDNMKSMREISVYLLAEETGNTAVKNAYKTKLRDHVAALYHIGQSEWDSEGYLDYSITPFLNLFDYTTDPEVKKYAKAALDWYYIGAASRYYRGLYAGPSKRAYGGNNVVFTGQSSFAHLMFGQTPIAANKFPRQGIWQMLSGYRPPQAAYELAQKNFLQNTEQLNTKPPYATYSPTATEKPETFETMYYGNTYHYGSVVSGGENGDVRPFKMVAFNSARGSDGFYVSTTSDGTPQYTKRSGDQMGQYRNLLVWLRPDGNYKYSFMVPNTATLEVDGGIWFFKYEKTWLAVRPINLNFPVANALTGDEINETNYVATPTVAGAGMTGFAMEIGEENQSSFADFKTAVKAKTLDVSQLASNKTLTLTGTDNAYLKMTYNTGSDFPVLYRNSVTPYDWNATGNYGVYHSATPPSSTINSAVPSGANVTVNVTATDLSRGILSEGWKQGTLSVVTDNWVFTQSMATDGTVTWTEEAKTAANSKGKIAKVEFYALGEKVGEVINPITDQFNFVWNNAYNGTYAITAKAIDAEGNVTVSNGVQVTVTGGSNPPVVGTGTGLSAKYYNDLFFTGTLVEKIDATIGFDWGSGSPTAGIAAGTYTVQWNGWVQAKYSGTYTFYTLADDGIKLWVNGNQLVDNWQDQGPSERSGTVTLTAGQKYAIQIQYYNNALGGVAKLYWSHAQQPKEIVPQLFLYPDGVVANPDGTGLQAVYYDNIDFTGTQLSRVDPTVNFNWGSGSPGASIGNDTFSARWTGEVKANYTQTYTFYTNSDDGVRLWVNGTQIINNWTDHGPTENSGTIALTAGQRYTILMEYYEKGGGAVATLSWSSASTPKAIIPAVSLYSTSQGARMAASVEKEAADLNEINAYPNPATEVLYIDLFAKQREEVSLALVNVTGVRDRASVQVVEPGRNTLKVNIRGMQDGLYLLSIQRANGRVIKKIMIVH